MSITPQFQAKFQNAQQKMKRMAVTSDNLKHRITTILRQADLATMKKGDVRRQLEDDLGLTLSSRKEEINGLIDEAVKELDAEDDEEDEPIKESHILVNYLVISSWQFWLRYHT